MPIKRKQIKKVMVYTLNYCPYCFRVKELLQSKGIKFEEIDLTDNDTLRAEVAKRTSQQTAPQVFVDDKPIGGYKDVRRLDEKGVLKKMIFGG